MKLTLKIIQNIFTYSWRLKGRSTSRNSAVKTAISPSLQPPPNNTSSPKRSKSLSTLATYLSIGANRTSGTSLKNMGIS